MKTYLLLIRGINVGGKNPVPMARLKTCLEGFGFNDVLTYIASGNVFLDSDKSAVEVRDLVEKTLPMHFKLDPDLIKVLVLTHAQLKKIVVSRPQGFGDAPTKYHSDAIFLIDTAPARAFSVFNPKDGIDTIWKGTGVIYSQRLSAMRTKSRLNRIMRTPIYRNMTIRNWNTTTKLLELLNKRRSAR